MHDGTDEGAYLTGRRIFLREVRRSDVTERYRGWLNDPAVNRFLETRFSPRSLENIAGFVESMDADPDSKLFAVCRTQDSAHIGNIKLGPINWIHRRADISLLIGERSEWGKGIAAEVIGLVVEFAFRDLDLAKLAAGCYAPNVGSRKAFEKNRFTVEGTLKAHAFSDGERVDEIVLGLTRADWENRS